MSDEPAAPEHHPLRDRVHRIEARVHEGLLAAELAAEEAAAFGAGTAFVEAVEAAADPHRVDVDSAGPAGSPREGAAPPDLNAGGTPPGAR